MPNANLLSIKDLNEKTFRIPAYQRGYRWTRRQIKDLVCDLSEFSKIKYLVKYIDTSLGSLRTEFALDIFKVKR